MLYYETHTFIMYGYISGYVCYLFLCYGCACCLMMVSQQNCDWCRAMAPSHDRRRAAALALTSINVRPYDHARDAVC
jgi:hypothetical protein